MDREGALKSRIMAELPSATFTKQPRLLVWYAMLSLIIVVLTLTVASNAGHWPVKLLQSFILGNVYSSFFFLGHELAHGADSRTQRFVDKLLYLPFLIFCLSPSLWKIWHNVVHHGNTNVEGIDTDNFGTLFEYNNDPLKPLMVRLIPGSRRALGIAYMLVGFTIQVQVVLWLKSRHSAFKHLDRRRAIWETGGALVFWLILGVTLGMAGTLFAVVVPMCIANGVTMSYILTNHLLRPLVSERDTLATAMSVRTFRFVDMLHFSFSHHVEHHLFPRAPSKYLPLIRRTLRRYAGERYVEPQHWKALLTVFSSPRVYKGPDVLIDPVTGTTVTIEELTHMLETTSEGALTSDVN